MKTVSIVGHGYVGKAMGRFFDGHYNLIFIDKNYVNSSNENYRYSNQFSAANNSDLVVISLPTPPRENDEGCDFSLVEQSIREIDAELFLIKSTVEPGVTDRLKKETGKRIVFSPEYCGESKYWTEYKFHTDVKETPWFTFGGDPEDTEKCVEFFAKVVGPTKTYHQTDAITAELAKYVENTFYAMKVTFCYEIAEIAQKMGIDYYKLREAWLLDPRINPMHTAVFSHNTKPYSGACFPKDVKALIRAAESLGYDAQLISEINKSNDRIGKIRSERKE